jgi:hypothetical protein
MKRHMKHWQDGVSTLVGVWLIISPWVLGLDIHTSVAAFGCFVVIGVLLCACGLCEFFIPEAWEEYSELYLGALLMVSPWMLEYKAALPVATSMAMACGGLVLAMALWVLVTDDQFGWMRRRLAH